MIFLFFKKYLFLAVVISILLTGFLIENDLKSGGAISVENLTAGKFLIDSEESEQENDEAVFEGSLIDSGKEIFLEEDKNIKDKKSEDEDGDKLAGPIRNVIFENARVVRVIDGDTIEIEGGEKIRYVGINTPESVDPRKPMQCFGMEASKRNKELVEGKIIQLEKDITSKDKYGRFLRYVWMGDIFVNLELVKQGFAYSYSYPPDIKYQDLFVEAQREARESGRGLWDSCFAVDSFQAQNFVVSDSNFNENCLIKGNINSLGEKIYHFLGCSFYAKTKIDESRGERWFCSESEALTAGWRKALNCP